MDRTKYRLRPFAEDDYEAASRIMTTATPRFPSTPEDERHWDRLLSVAHHTNEKWMVDERATGQAVAICWLNHTPYSYDPHKFQVGIVVDPLHRRQGIGRELASLLEFEAAAHRATSFWVSISKEETVGIEFAQKVGFEELRTTWMSVLDLSEVAEMPPPPRAAALERDGIRFTTLAEEGPRRPEVRRQLYDLMTEASRDIPRMWPYTPIPFEQFVAQLEGPHVLPEAYFLAGHGEAYVGVSCLERDFAHPDSLTVGFTGTRASFRGKGIASELKRRTIAYAQGRGVRYLRTFNDSLNEPMWAINQKLGFRRTVEWSNREKRFASGASSVSPAPG